MSTSNQFTLSQAIAWIIWRDADHSLRLDLQPANDEDAFLPWWNATADKERRIRDAAVELAKKINDGAVSMSGWRVSEGTPLSVYNAEYVNHIPIATARHILAIPIEWLEITEGGCVVFNDRIANGAEQGTLFCRVTVDADAVRTTWPDSNSPSAILVSATVKRTGAPGRSSSMHLIEHEFMRRASAGCAKPELAKEAKELRAWLEKNYPEWPPPSAKTIANRIRGRHRDFHRGAPDIID